MNRLLLALGMVASAMAGGPAWGIPSVYDGFDYANDSTSLEGQAGGYGWDGPWAEVGGNTTSFQFIPSNNDTSLTLPTLPFAPSGDHVVATGPGGGNNNFIARPLEEDLSLAEDNTFYASYLIQKTGGAAGTTANNQELDLYDGGTVSLRMGSTSGNTFFLGAASNFIATPLNLGESYFVVAKMAASAAGTDVVSASVFDASEAIPAAEPGAYDLTYDIPAERGNDVIDTVRLWIGSNAAGSFDEVRLGRTWQDVTSINPNWILGDFDQIGGLQPADYNILASNLFTGTTYEEGDINFSGRVDLNDFALFRDIYTAAGLVLPPGAPGVAVPEPATWLALVGAAVVAPLWLRRRKVA